MNTMATGALMATAALLLLAAYVATIVIGAPFAALSCVPGLLRGR